MQFHFVRRYLKVYTPKSLLVSLILLCGCLQEESREHSEASNVVKPQNNGRLAELPAEKEPQAESRQTKGRTKAPASDTEPVAGYSSPEEVYLAAKNSWRGGDYAAVYDCMMPELQAKTVGAIILSEKFQRDYVKANDRGATTDMLKARQRQSVTLFEKHGITDARLEPLGTGDDIAYAKNRFAIVADDRVDKAAEIVSEPRTFFTKWHELDDTPTTLHIFTMAFGEELRDVRISGSHAKGTNGVRRLAFEKTDAGWLVKSY